MRPSWASNVTFLSCSTSSPKQLKALQHRDLLKHEWSTHSKIYLRDFLYEGVIFVVRYWNKSQTETQYNNICPGQAIARASLHPPHLTETKSLPALIPFCAYGGNMNMHQALNHRPFQRPNQIITGVNTITPTNILTPWHGSPGKSRKMKLSQLGFEWGCLIFKNFIVVLT